MSNNKQTIKIKYHTDIPPIVVNPNGDWVDCYSRHSNL